MAARAPAITSTFPVTRYRDKEEQAKRTCHLSLKAGYISYYGSCQRAPRWPHPAAEVGQSSFCGSGTSRKLCHTRSGICPSLARPSSRNAAPPYCWAVVPAPYGPVKTQDAKKRRQVPPALNRFQCWVQPVPETPPVLRFRCPQGSEADASVVGRELHHLSQPGSGQIC